jgi:hypothetical protein
MYDVFGRWILSSKCYLAFIAITAFLMWPNIILELKVIERIIHKKQVGEDGAQWVTNLLFRDYYMNGCMSINEVPNDRGWCCPQMTTVL